MGIQKTEAVLLKKKDFRETSLILTFFTRDFGKVNGILKGARGSKARSIINPLFFSIDQIVFYERKKRDFFIISQCETDRIFFNILKDWNRAAVGYYVLELVDVFTEPGEKEERLFEILINTLVSLEERKEPGAIARLFEIKFLKIFGWWPGAEAFKLTRGAMSTILCYENEPWLSASKIKLTRDVGEEIKKITGKIIKDNLDRPLKTTKIFASAVQ